MKVSKRCIRETIGEWRQMENGRRKRVKGGCGGWLMVDGSCRMRVIIMTDVVYSHFPSHHLFWGSGKPTHSLCVTREYYSAMPSRVITPDHPLILEASPSLIPALLPSDFSVSFLLLPLLLRLSPSLHQLLLSILLFSLLLRPHGLCVTAAHVRC